MSPETPEFVAPGPGALADVTIRYKDLVYLKNGVARDNLTLERRTTAQGPLERNVLKNLLAYELSLAFERAGQSLGKSEPSAAIAALVAMRDLLVGMRHTVVGLSTDRNVQTDIALLDEYTGLLRRGAAEINTGRAHIADSLRFSGLLKVLPRPEWE